MEAAPPTTAGGDPGEDPPAPNAAASKLRLLCSHGGQILPRPHDKSSLYYAGGDTRLVSVPRHAALPDLRSTLSRLFSIGGGGGFFLKYQLPSEGLDCLVSVASDEDLENMVVEYDRVAGSAGKNTRLRLFVFPAKNPKVPPPMPVGSVFDDAKLESWFADAALGDGAGKVPGVVEVQSLPDSPLLDNSSSSFGSPSSLPSAGSGGGGAPAILEAQFSEINVSGKKLEECPKNGTFGIKDEAFEIKEGDFLPTPAATATTAPFIENPIQNGAFFSCGEDKSENTGIRHSLLQQPDIATGQTPTSDGQMRMPEKTPSVVFAPADAKQETYSYAHGRPQLVPVQPYYHQIHQTIHPQYQMMYTPQIPAYFVPVQPPPAYPMPVGSVQAPDMNDASKIPLPSPVLLARGGAAKSELATSAGGNSHRTNAAAARSAVAQPVPATQYIHFTDQTPQQYMNFHHVHYGGAPSPAAGYPQPVHYAVTPPPTTLPSQCPVASSDAAAGASDAPCNTAAEA